MIAPHPAWRPQINRSILPSYLRHGYVPSPHSIFEHLHKLEPGHIAQFDTALANGDGEPRMSRYWDLRAIAGRQRQIDTGMDEVE